MLEAFSSKAHKATQLRTRLSSEDTHSVSRRSKLFNAL